MDWGDLMLVDAHCHLLGSHWTEDKLCGALNRARQAGVSGFVVVGTDLEESEAVLGMTQLAPDMAACLGVHPHEAKTWDSGSEARLRTLLQAPSVRFVGETGLDWHYDFSPREQQEAVFRSQIRLAREVGKPLMIHTREAGQRTLEILEEEGAETVRGIIHCYSEDLPFARRALDLGFLLSFSGIITFKNAEALREVARWAPLDRLLVETDCPFLAPVPFRGKPNEPAHVKLVAECLAGLRGLDLDQAGALTTRNLEALCGWSPAC